MRMFIGVELDNETKNQIADAMKYIEAFAESRIMTDKSNLHLTLLFLGEVEPCDVDKIEICIKSLKTKLKASVFEAFSFGTFKNDRITYLAVNDDGLLQSLHNMLIGELQNAGFNVYDSAFNPHITLARNTRYNNTDELLKTVLHKIRINCNNVTLFHSYRDGKLIYKPIYKEALN